MLLGWKNNNRLEPNTFIQCKYAEVAVAQTVRFSTVRRILLVSELGLTRTLLILGIVVAPYYNIQWPGGGWVGAAVLLFSGCLLALLLSGASGERLGNVLSAAGTRLGLFQIILFGLFAQIGVALITDPVLVSDPRTYLALAERLAGGMDYMDEAGHRAFWPPGLPLFLMPFVALFGSGAMAIAVANMVLYMIGAIAAWDLGRKIFTPQVGILAALLFTIWPSRLLCAALASKENLTVAMLLAGTTLCLGAFQSSGRRSWFFAAGAGVSFGLAALAQPGLVLFVAAVPIIFRSAFSVRLQPYIARSVVVIGCAVMCLLPWHIRNCVVFDGQFCGIATNGGSVFYRANNPKATGLWIEEGEVPISKLPELAQNQLGFELGKKWIRENPEDFLKLAAKKLVHLFGDDSYGAAFGILRGGGLDHEQALKNSSPERLWSYRIASWVSLAFWVMVLAWSARAIGNIGWNAQFPSSERLLPLVYPLMYSAAVFSVFESGSRQHTAAQGLLLVLAASFLVNAHAKRRQQ